MPALRTLLGGSTGPFIRPPLEWPADYLSLAHNNAASVDDNRLHAFTSPDGIDWTDLGNVYPSHAERDPSLLADETNRKWWVCCTTVGPGDYFDVFSVEDYGDEMTFVDNPTTVIGASFPTATWAPQWFVDDDGSIHVIVSLLFSNRKLYELHPTNEAMTTWSEAVQITGTGFASNTIDGNLTLYGGVYYLLWKDDDTGLISLSTSSSPFSGYTLAQTGNWAGWGPGSIEGPQIVDIGTGWRVYFSQNSGFNANNIYYSETTDRTMATGWSDRTAVTDFSGFNHPLPIKKPV